MTVLAILAEKGREVVTVGPEETVARTAETLAARRIGAVVVVGGDGSPVGIVSERDIVRALARHGAEALHRQVDSVMTSRIVTCAEPDTIHDVMQVMTRGRFRHLPVMADGSMVGIVSIGDVVKHRIGEVEREAEDMRLYIANA